MNNNLNDELSFKNTCVLILNPETLKCEAITSILKHLAFQQHKQQLIITMIQNNYGVH